MTCDEARLLIGAEPGASTPALEEHLQGCPECARLRTEMRALDEQLRRALAQPPQSGRTRRPVPAVRQWALAASMVLAILAAGALWLLRPSDTLARDVVAHVQGEPQSWLATQHVDAQAIATALHGAGVALDLTSDQIVYAQSCWFRGHYVPHLVVETAHGPATVLILRHEHVDGRRSFDERGMGGVIVPAGSGSIAVLERGGGNSGNLEQLAQQMQRDVRWLPDGH
ncbi:MAG TPA: DUF3379 family protein [Steroidobacteraceae bacterium]|nr:DUF3379 family protein [Steroidobacteraceae bacterium]